MERPLLMSMRVRRDAACSADHGAVMQVETFESGHVSVYIVVYPRSGERVDRWISRWAVCTKRGTVTQLLARGDDRTRFVSPDEASWHGQKSAAAAVAAINGLCDQGRQLSILPSR